MRADLQDLVSTVRHNCSVSDARHARDYSLCVYLLKMRELYRWEQGLGFTGELPRDQVGVWLREREQRWEELEEAEFEPLPIAGSEIDPFASDEVNRHLVDDGLIYSGGLGVGATPHFFLAELIERQDHGDHTVLVTGREHARDLTAPPAMSLGNTVFLRRESLRRLIWEKVEESRWNSQDGPLQRAFAELDFDHAAESSLEWMTDQQLESVLLHERGEVEAGRLLGPLWEEMLITLPRSKAELIARAIRDHLADALVTLPQLVERGCAASLHFYLGQLNPMRRRLVPALFSAYEGWRVHGDWQPIKSVAEQGREHWLGLARELLSCFREQPEALRALLNEMEERVL